MTYYLIDLENVHRNGLAGCQHMKPDDRCMLFYTCHVNRNKIKEWAKDCTGIVSYHQVPSGKESLDRHLISCLGFLMGIGSKTDSYVIISCDKGFVPVVKFWKNEGFDVKRMRNVDEERLQYPDHGRYEKMYQHLVKYFQGDIWDETLGEAMTDADIIACIAEKFRGDKSKIHGKLCSIVGQDQGRMIYYQMRRFL